MSAELIWGILIGVVGIGATIAVAVWQQHSEQHKRSLPPKNDVTYLALQALVAAQTSSSSSNTVLNDDQLFKQIIEDWNDYTSGGNFDPTSKNKRLRSYVDDSIERLHRPKSQSLGPLIESRDRVYKVTPLGVDIFAKLPTEHSEGVQTLIGHLNGRLDTRLAGSSGAVEQAPAARRRSRPRTPEEWRHTVFMVIPEDEVFERNELKHLIGQELSISSLRTTAPKKIEDSIIWNLNNGNLSLEADGRIRLAVPKTSKTSDDFK